MEIVRFRIDEACEKLGVEESFIVRCIRSHWIQPAGPYELDIEDIARAELVRELQDELGVNDDSVPIILSLIDRLLYLEDRLRHAGRFVIRRGGHGTI